LQRPRETRPQNGIESSKSSPRFGAALFSIGGEIGLIRILRLALILDLADDELDLFVDPVIALEAVSTRERAAVGGVNRQPRPVIEGEIWLFELALSHIHDPHSDCFGCFDVVDLEK